jgi:hypothetical protein
MFREKIPKRSCDSPPKNKINTRGFDRIRAMIYEMKPLPSASATAYTAADIVDRPTQAFAPNVTTQLERTVEAARGR